MEIIIDGGSFCKKEEVDDLKKIIDEEMEMKELDEILKWS